MQRNTQQDKPATSETKTPPSGVSSPTSRAPVWAILTIFIIFGTSLAAWMTREQWMTPRSLDGLQRLAARKQWDKADRLIHRYLAAHPNDPEAMLLRGRMLAAQENFVECARQLESVPSDTIEYAQALLRAGEAWERAHRRRDAERVWKKCLAVSTGDLELPLMQQQCRRLLCRLYAVERRRDDLWAMTEEMLQRTAPQQRHEPLAMRTRFEFVMVDPQVALGELDLALEQNPTDSLTRRAAGLYELEAGNTEKARTHLYKCLQEDRDSLPAWESWLQCLYQTADIFGLEQAIRELPPSAESSAACWKYRAIVAERKEDMDGAIAAGRRAIERCPSEAEHYHRLGQFLLRAGSKEEGQSFLARNKELQDAQQKLRESFDAYRRDFTRGANDEKVDIAFRLGQGYDGLGRSTDAAAWYRFALSEDPAHAQSISALERIQSGMGNQ